MIESGVKILGLDIIADLDGVYFPVETVAERSRMASSRPSYKEWGHMKDTIDKTAITARITQLEHEIPQDQARVESEMTRLAMKRGALLELRQLLAVKAPEKPQEIAKSKAPVKARRTR